MIEKTNKNNFFEKEFEHSTKTKLQLYSEYLKGWFPVFAHGPNHNTINIIDFFAGPGTDDKGNLGSPLIALKEADNYKDDYIKQNRKVNFYFYDRNKEATELLSERVKPWINENSPFIPKVINQEFPNSLENHINNLIKPNDMNLIFIDQFGIKNMTKSMFTLLSRHKKNDLLFFVSSSFFKRFASKPEFSRLFPEITKQEVDDIPQKQIHSYIAKKYESWLPKGSIFISHFSLENKGNVYGLIFVSHNLLGLRKFLDSCWKIDEETGESNFYDPTQLRFFISEKIDNFQQRLKEKLIDGRIDNERMLYQYTLLEGMLPKHTKSVINSLYKDKIITNPEGKKPRNSKDGYSSPKKIIVNK